jgi:hypothetical protein
VLVLLLAIACTESKKPPAPTADPEADARARLSVLAQATADGRYDATYRFVQRPSNATGTIRIRQAPPQYRIDVTSKGTASFFALANGVVSCTIKAKGTSCFLVARPGEEVPPLFDPGVQRLFRDAVEELARHPTEYHVTLVEPTPAATDFAPTTPPVTTPPATTAPAASASAAPLPVGTCFVVDRVTTASPSPGTTAAGFENGTYCFAEQGVATRIEVASGVLELVRLGGAPDRTWFTVPAKVQSLPTLPPSPKPTATR